MSSPSAKKTCSRCGLKKPLRDFYRQAGGAQGRRGMCKECFRAAERASYASKDSKTRPQVPAQCGQCGGGMELLEQGGRLPPGSVPPLPNEISGSAEASSARLSGR